MPKVIVKSFTMDQTKVPANPLLGGNYRNRGAAMKFNTLVIHGGIDGDTHTGSVNVPIYQTSTYKQPAPGQHTGYEYSRTGNPTRSALEELIKDLEKGDRGFAFSSGMAAISSVFMLFKAGTHIILSDDVYGGTFRVVDKVFRNLGLEFTFVNTSNLQEIKGAVQPNTRACYVETPTNPLMKLTDLQQVASFTQQQQLLLIVDSTFMTPYLQRPLELGADIVLHSATKYLSGHSDVVAGLVVTASQELSTQMHFVQNSVGAVLGPQDSWLLIKGMKTLALRMERHCENAEAVVKGLQEQPWVTRIYYPGLDQNTNAKNQLASFGGMISFDVASEATLDKLLTAIRTFTLAESLGGVESLLSVPAKMTHASIPPDTRARLGITDTLVRISVKFCDLQHELGNVFVADQFNNKANPEAHYRFTGPEIYQQLDGNIDYFVTGAGSGGTLSGVMRYLRKRNPTIKGIMADPEGSIMGGGKCGSYAIEGIGNDFIPTNLHLNYVDKTTKVNDKEAFMRVTQLAQREGLLVGSSSGAAFHAALQLANEIEQSNIVVVFPDRGERYLSQGLFAKGNEL